MIYYYLLYRIILVSAGIVVTIPEDVTSTRKPIGKGAHTITMLIMIMDLVACIILIRGKA